MEEVPQQSNTPPQKSNIKIILLYMVNAFYFTIFSITCFVMTYAYPPLSIAIVYIVGSVVWIHYWRKLNNPIVSNQESNIGTTHNEVSTPLAGAPIAIRYAITTLNVIPMLIYYVLFALSMLVYFLSNGKGENTLIASLHFYLVIPWLFTWYFSHKLLKKDSSKYLGILLGSIFPLCITFGILIPFILNQK